jgi:predicted metal-binding membrane protein
LNLVWIAALALFVLAEKVLLIGPIVGVAAGVVSTLIGLVMVVGVRLPV